MTLIDVNLSGTLVVRGLVHALLGANRGGVAIRHEGGHREPLAARVSNLLLEKQVLGIYELHDNEE